MPGSDTRPKDLKGYSDQVKIRHVTGADIQALAFFLAEAFRDDPYHRWIFPNSSVRTKRQWRFFTLSLQRRIGKEAIFTTTGLQGVAAWSGPETPKSSILDILRFKLLFGLNIGLRAPFLLPGVRRVLSRQPKYPHWYLSILATAPEHQGQGVGTALLEPILSQCDSKCIPAYLEATSRTSVSFYERIGFVVTDEIRLPFGPVLWPMLREPS